MIILFDIGGTKTRIARSKDGHSFDEPVVFKTPQGFDDAMAVYKRETEVLLQGEVCNKAVVGVAGTRDEVDTLIHSPNLRGWEDQPIRSGMVGLLGTDNICFENDAALAGLGEAHYGAGQGYKIVSYVTVSTGVGGAKIVDGKIDANSQGFEPGQQLIDGPDGAVSLEDLVSGRALYLRFDSYPKDIPQDNPVWEEIAQPLSLGLHNMFVMWSPDVLVLGGSMITGDPAISIASIERELASLPQVFTKPLTIKKAQLGDFGGIWGGLAKAQVMYK